MNPRNMKPRKMKPGNNDVRKQDGSPSNDEETNDVLKEDNCLSNGRKHDQWVEQKRKRGNTKSNKTTDIQSIEMYSRFSILSNLELEFSEET